MASQEGCGEEGGSAVTFLFIDFAERYSAAILMDVDGVVLGESTCDHGALSRPPTAEQMLAVCDAAHEWATGGVMRTMLEDAQVVAIEDVNPFVINPKPVLRAQGVFFRACRDVSGVVPLLVQPSIWQRHHGYKKQKGVTSKGWAKALCTELGYTAGGKGKQNVDLRDAFLGARWMSETLGKDI